MRINIKENLFYVPWTILIANTILAQSYLSHYSYRCFTIVGILLLIWRIISQKTYKQSEFMCFLVLLLATAITAYVSKDNRLLWCTIAIGAMEKINIQKIIKITCYTMAAMIAVIAFSCILLYGNVGTSLKGGLALGLGHPNILHGYFSLIIVMLVYLNWNKLRKSHIILLELINLMLYLITISRTGMGILSIILLMILIYKICPTSFILKFYKIAALIGIGIFTILPILYYYNPENFILQSIDSVMTGRLWQGAWYYNISKIKLFGNYYEELYVANPFALLDMGFFRIIIEYGIIAYLIFVTGYYKLLTYTMKTNVSMFFLIMLMILFSYTESLGTYVFFNVTLLGFSTVLFKANRNILLLGRR